MPTCPEYDAFAEFYDYVVPYRNRRDLDFFVELARAATSAVLEVGCGTGRVLIPCARAGAAMTGLDLSPGMLDVCRERLRQEPVAVQTRVELHQGDMRDFDLGRRFDLVTIPFRGFQHLLPVADQRQALSRIRQHLVPGGRFVLDLFNPSLPFLGDERWLVQPLVEPAFIMPDGRSVVRSYRIAARDYFNQIQDVEMVHEITWPDGRTERRTEQFRLRYLFRFEVEHLLEREGFRVEQIYGDYEKGAYGETAYPGELVVMARRR
jgi:SAM-dependent methyltransferase